MDSKPLLQERPPAYASVQGGYNYGQQHNYGAIPPPAPAPPPPGFHEPPPPPPYYTGGQGYAQPAAALPPVAQQPNFSNTYTIIQPSVVVVGAVLHAELVC